MPWNGGPAGDGRSSCSRDPRRGGEPSHLRYISGRKRLRETLAGDRCCPRTLAGLADWSPEGTEERRAPCNAVYTALPQRGRPSRPCIRAFWPKTIDPQIRLRPGRVTLTPILASTRSDIPRIRSWNTIGAAPPSSPSWPPQPPWRKRGKHCALTWEASQEALVCHIQYIIVYISLQYIYIYIYIYV